MDRDLGGRLGHAVAGRRFGHTGPFELGLADEVGCAVAVPSL